MWTERPISSHEFSGFKKMLYICIETELIYYPSHLELYWLIH